MEDGTSGAGQAIEVPRVVTEGMVEEEGEAMEEAAFDSATAPVANLAFGDGDEADRNDSATTPIQLRTNFDPLAVFAPTAQTDANGQAQVTFTLPDNLTRYRIMAVAVAGERQFGAAESNLTARLPLMIRPSAPPLS